MPQEARTIRILQTGTNRKGDLFGKMIEDYFLTLGYSEFRLNVHKPGREIDLEGSHQTENRSFRAECKATAAPIGGDDVNKFFGSLDAERRARPGDEVSGYFVSLNGFTETAIEQEKAAGQRLIFVDADEIVLQLIRGRIIASETKAVEIAALHVPQGSGLRAFDPPELLLHELGWIWLVYFGSQKEKTHFVLVHGDGEPLSPTLANKVITVDVALRGTLHGLTVLNHVIGDIGNAGLAQSAYVAFLERECGEIQLDGLPADQEIGTRHLKLETIFVPLHLTAITDQVAQDEEKPHGSATAPRRRRRRTVKSREDARQSLGVVLRRNSRIAILGPPGGGKSTLIKRLVTAYAQPQRRGEVSDSLPNRQWLPLFIRCRQLQELVRLPFAEIIEGLARRAELGGLCTAFCQLISQSLQEGSVLLLVDGLDEISEDGDRASFVNQLRIFLARYPSVALVLTSREAGFRIIAGAVAGICKAFKLAEFNDADIERLTVAWHKEVVGTKAEIISEAKKLAAIITETDRVRGLAANPLLLTTLLLVKRWVGQLPTRRTVLYGKAIEVLLMTWNVEGHEPLDLDEVLPQLEFVAFTMMNDGMQRISSRRLKELLLASRAQMPEILGFATISVGEFVDRVELRSSILTLAGHGIEDGTLYPMYEFKHLTFQEYFAARAIVDGYYPGHQESDNILSVLEPHLKDESWTEVIPLVGVLSGRRVQPLIERLIAEAQLLPPNPDEEFGYQSTSPANLLMQCFIDEIQVSPQLAREGLKWAAKRASLYPDLGSLFREGKYAGIFEQLCDEEFTRSSEDLFVWGGSLARDARGKVLLNNTHLRDSLEALLPALSSSNAFLRAKALLVIMEEAFSSHNKDPIPPSDIAAFAACRSYVLDAINASELFVKFAALWANVWISYVLAGDTPDPSVWPKFLQIWQSTQSEDLRFLAAWNLETLPVRPRDPPPFSVTPDMLEAARQTIASTPRPGYRRYHQVSQAVAAIVGFYSGSVADEETLARVLASGVQFGSTNDLPSARLIEYLNALGEVGKQQLLDAKKRESRFGAESES